MLAAASDTVTAVSILVGVIIAVTAAFTAPLVLARRMDVQHREDREADWARQDLVAAKAAEAAELLEANNKQVAATAAKTTEQLLAIHAAVNSNLTARMTETLVATQAQLTLMQRLIPDPDAEEEATMRRLTETVVELIAQLGDRQ